MTAKEAREISDEAVSQGEFGDQYRRVTEWDDIRAKIEQSAEAGLYRCEFGTLTIKVRDRLRLLGYHVDHENYMIRWNARHDPEPCRAMAGDHAAEDG